MATTKATQDATAAEAGVATPSLSTDEYTQAVATATAKLPARPGSADAADFDRGWTAQSDKAAEAPEDRPGQRFAPWQLPDPAIAVASGHAPVVVPEHLITEDEDDPQGPEPAALGKTMYEVSEGVNKKGLEAYAESKDAVDERVAASAKASESPSAGSAKSTAKSSS